MKKIKAVYGDVSFSGNHIQLAKNIFKWERIDRLQHVEHSGYPTMATTIASSYNDTNVSSREVKKTTPQSFALVGRCTYLIHYEYVPQEVAISPTF